MITDRPKPCLVSKHIWKRLRKQERKLIKKEENFSRPKLALSAGKIEPLPFRTNISSASCEVDSMAAGKI